jgi:spore germination protein
MMKNKVSKKKGIIGRGILPLFLVIGVSGCAPQKVIDEIGIMHTIGVDFVNNKIMGSVLYPDFADKKNLMLVTAEADNLTTLKTNLDLKLQYPMELGQLRVLVLGDTLSKAGFSRVLETLSKDPSIGMINVVVADHSSRQFLQSIIKSPPLFLSNLIEQATQNEGLPHTSILSMQYQYFGEGIDVYLPNIQLDNQNKIELNGMSIFKKDKLKLRLSQKETFLFKTINEKNKKGTYPFKIRKNEKEANIGIQSLSGQHNIDINLAENEVLIKLNLNCELKGLPNWMDTRRVGELQQIAEKSMTNDIENLLVKLQSNQVDPLGLGMIYRSKSKIWSEDDFYNKVYPKFRFKVRTKIVFSQYGVTK